MEDTFKQSYQYAANQIDSELCAIASDEWLDSISKSIEEMGRLMEQEAIDKNLDVKQLKGFIAEIWHTKTLELNERKSLDKILAYRPDVNTRGSSDVNAGDKEYSLKYYGDAKNSAKAISETYWERFNSLNAKRQSKGLEPLNYEKYLQDNNLKSDEEAKMSLYYGQGKIIPSDQLEEAKKEIFKRLNRADTPEQKKRYKEIYDTLSDVVKDKKGNQSIKLTKEQANKLTQAAKNGDIREALEDCGIDVDSLVSIQDICKESFCAGLSAAAMTYIINLGPTIFNAISKYIQSGEINLDELKTNGINALKGTDKSLVTGTLTAGIVALCKSGKLGDEFKKTDSSLIATIVVVSINIIDLSMKCAKKEIDNSELARQMLHTMIVSGLSYAGSYAGKAFDIALAAAFPEFSELITKLMPVATTLGSFIGSIIGGFVYYITDNVIISFCIEHDCTFFGLVDQNYSLPNDVLEELELKTFDFESLDINEFEYNKFEPEYFNFDEFKYEQIGIKVLRRDLISAHSIGYVR